MSNKLTYLVIHCTATAEGREVTAADIKSWHLSPAPKGRGWKQVGYSDLIQLDGNIVNLVPYNNNDIVDAWEITNGAAGINSVSRHIVYAGGCDKKGNPKDTRTVAQLLALEAYVKAFIRLHPSVKIAGHNQFATKACPSFDTVQWCRAIGIPEKNIYVK